MRANFTVAILLAYVVIGLGVALIVVTLAQGGGEVGLLLGGMFLAAGCGRLYLARRG
ncbi:MAG TPA: hypothetical protein VGM80_02870 [Gaiellaceae bacterium]|jgi:hypothetical protein